MVLLANILYAANIITNSAHTRYADIFTIYIKLALFAKATLNPHTNTHFIRSRGHSLETSDNSKVFVVQRPEMLIIPTCW